MKLLLNTDVMQNFIIKSFVFLGPIGVLIPSFTGIDAFRFYYFLLPVGILLFLWKPISSIAITRILILFPILAYMLFSSSKSSLWLVFDANGKSHDFLFRFFLLLALMVFAILAGTIAAKYNYKTKVNLITLYVSGYIFSLISGYILYTGYYMNLFSVEFISKFHIILDYFPYGLFIRFAPGSYANEYGIVSSFVLSLITFLIIEHKKIISPKNKTVKMFFLLLLYIFISVALILTTTRAAYIAYLVSLLYLIFKRGNTRRIIKMLLSISAVFLLFIYWLKCFNDISIFNHFIENIEEGLNHTLGKGTIDYGRVERLQESLDLFYDSPLLGVGFGTVGVWLHNTYMQMFIELGAIGTTILLMCIMFFILYEKSKKPICVCGYFKVVSNLATMHVLWFAASNHNLNHHLTWFCLFLYLMFQENLKHNRELYKN